MIKIKHLLLSAMALAAINANAVDQQPKYIFYYIGDGMGMGPTVAAEMYNRQVLGNPTPITMLQFPVVSWCLTYSASSPVTDSAAAGTALSTGVKTKNGMLGMGPDTTAVYSIAKDLQADGYGIGIVTSVAADDATPGAFWAHVANRSNRYEVDIQAANSGYQFIAGAGFTGLTDKEGKSTGAQELIEEKGYTIVRGPKAMEQTEAEKIMLFNEEGLSKTEIGYTIDSIQGALTLPYLTQKCLDQMEKVSPDRFFMMVEGGNIDHALHANDGGAAIKEILNFNQALDIAYDFYKQHPDETLIIVTADHDTGGMSVGNRHTGYGANLQNIDYQKVSKEKFEEYCNALLKSRRTYTWDDMKSALGDYFGLFTVIQPNEKQANELKEKFEATFVKRKSKDEKTLYANFNSFVSSVFKVFNDCAGIGFIASSHTGNPVPLMAVGVGADRFKNLNNNIEISQVIRQLIGAQWK